MDILYQFNEKYAPYASVSIISLFINNKNRKITVHILGENLSESSMKKYKDIADEYNQNIVIYETEGVIQKLKEMGVPSYRGSYSANLRMMPTSFVGDNIDRLLYLDADTIVNGDIYDLFSMKLENNVVAMVIDSLGNCNYKQKLGFSDKESYYNSGVILYDMVKWKELQISQQILDYISQNDVKFASPDQDLINIVLKGKIRKISPKYNFQPIHKEYTYIQYMKCFGTGDYYTEEEIKDAMEDTRIYHSFRYVGEFPWDRNTIHPYKKMFYEYISNGPWFDYVPEQSEATWIMKAEKILYLILPKSIFLKLFALAHKKYVSCKSEVA